MLLKTTSAITISIRASFFKMLPALRVSENLRPAVPFSFSADGQNPPMNLQRLPKLVSQAIGGIP
jgi:hypothetical protein